MVNKLLQPQELEVFYIIPAIKKEIAVCMKEMGYKQKDIAKRLFATEPAISQYLSLKRAAEVDFDSSVKREIKNSVKNITDKKSLTETIQALLKKINRKGVTCGICKKKIMLEENCNICFR